MSEKPFQAIIYNQPRKFSSKKEIEKFIGIDTEAYEDGRPFLVCSSAGDVWDVRNTGHDIPECFFDGKFEGHDFVFYNMRYDTGAIFRTFLDFQDMKKLWRYNTVTVALHEEKLKIDYIPHKCLKFTKNKITRIFWDIAQYYRTSLDAASLRYLSEKKMEIETKRFSADYVTKNWKKIVEYCIRDAMLTARLAGFFRDSLVKFGIPVSALYSSASLSFHFFHKKVRIQNIWDLYRYYPEAVKFAHEAYQGGKFEVTARGSFNCREYDIISAYPYEMSALSSLRDADVLHGRKIPEDATYGYIRCHIQDEGSGAPCHGLLMKNVRVYPKGRYYATLTLNEYRYMSSLDGVSIKIMDGYFLVSKYPELHPYKKIINFLYKIKDTYKDSDEMLYILSKIMLNGYYGKLVQLNENHVKSSDNKIPGLPVDEYDEVSLYKAGAGWNPFYAAEITANTRIRMCRYQNEYGPDCIAVHTDSILLRETAPLPETGKRIGDIKLELTGPALIIMSGMYDAGKKTAYRGFEMKKNFRWRELLEQYPSRSEYTFNQLRVVSWTQACAWDDVETTNQFQDYPKKISLNTDVKRIWPHKATGKKLLSGLTYSEPVKINMLSPLW